MWSTRKRDVGSRKTVQRTAVGVVTTPRLRNLPPWTPTTTTTTTRQFGANPPSSTEPCRQVAEDPRPPLNPCRRGVILDGCRTLSTHHVNLPPDEHVVRGSDPRWVSHPVHAPRARRAEGSRWEEDLHDPLYPPPMTRGWEDLLPRGGGGGGKHRRRSYSSPLPPLSPGRGTPSYRGGRLPDERQSCAEPRGDISWNDSYPSRESSRGMHDRQVPDDLVEDDDDTRALYNLLREHGRTLLDAYQRPDIDFISVFLETCRQVNPRT